MPQTDHARPRAATLCAVAILALMLASVACAGPLAAPPGAPSRPADGSTDSGGRGDMATAIGPGSLPSPRLAALQKGVEARVTREDIVSFTPPNASMRVAPMLAREPRPDWIAAVVAANNFGPAAASVGTHAHLRDGQGRTFSPVGATAFRQYDELLLLMRQQWRSLLADRELIPYTALIQPSQDAFVLLVFNVAPDSEDLVLTGG